jgi:predicted nucleic acid-binding protein
MSAERVTYLDSSAIVKLAVQEPESKALRAYLRRRRVLVSSSLARAEVARALAPLGDAAVRRGNDVLTRIDLIRVSDRILTAAGWLQPEDLRTLDAIHLATVRQIESDLSRVITYDERMAVGARLSGWPTVAPS